MLLASLPIFLGAFLLFLIQPLFAQTILPLLGGGAHIWITCTVVFQALLLMGYSYANWLSTYKKKVYYVHGFLLLATAIFCWFYPLFPNASTLPSNKTNPALSILILLIPTIAIPYFTLSTTSSMIQSLCSSIILKEKIYQLFSLSNAASLLALLSYPFFFEPFLMLSTRKLVWKYGLFAYLGCTLVFIIYARYNSTDHSEIIHPIEKPIPPTLNHKALWLTLSMASSAFLASSTYTLTQDISPTPLLWLLPLSIYLLTFIISFRSTKPYSFIFWQTALLKLTTLWVLLQLDLKISAVYLVIALSLLLWTICYICHQELSKLKPNPYYLTQFYFYISLGGSLGSLLAGIIAPITIGYANLFPFLVFIIFIFLMLRTAYHQTNVKLTQFPNLNFNTLFKKEIGQTSIYLILLLSTYAFITYHSNESRVASYHNFYGSIQVSDWKSSHAGGTSLIRTLVHGNTLHGYELFTPLTNIKKHHETIGYYAKNTGIETVFDILHKPSPSLEIGIMGMGVGALSYYAKLHDSFRFYEINPAMITAAYHNFTYVQEAQERGATTLTVLGDGRLSLAKERNNPLTPPLDMLILDAFNSDSIPMHLLTEEAMSTYKQRLKKNGTLLVHMSNRHINLRPIAAHIAQQLKWKGLILSTIGKNKNINYTINDSEWAVISANPEIISTLSHHPNAEALVLNPLISPWTDEQTSLHCLWKAFPCNAH
jgi:hypothetical protein